MFLRGSLRSSASPAALLVALAIGFLATLGIASAAGPFGSATVTRVENRVNYGERAGNRSRTRVAAVADVLRENNFLLSETDSRAELEYPDGSVVRIGQNTVFTFDSQSRTLSLEKGSLLFHIPKGEGGGTIKTPSLTAAITGTAGKVSANYIAIVEGTVTLVPSGRQIHEGEFARRNGDGSITIAKFDPSQVNEGKLVNFNGHMPGFPESRLVVSLEPPNVRDLTVIQRTQSLPGSVEHFFPNVDNPPPPRRENTRTNVPPPKNNPPQPTDNNPY